MAEISNKLVNKINSQINAELESAYLYLGMAHFYAEKGLNGFVKLFEKQAKEEVEHAERFLDYLKKESKTIVLKDIKAPTSVYKDLREPLVEQLEHERLVTSLIYELVELAEKEKDYRTLSFLKWYVDEQAEEEEHSRDLLTRYDLIKGDVAALLKWDASFLK